MKDATTMTTTQLIDAVRGDDLTATVPMTEIVQETVNRLERLTANTETDPTTETNPDADIKELKDQVRTLTHHVNSLRDARHAKYKTRNNPELRVKEETEYKLTATGTVTYIEWQCQDETPPHGCAWITVKTKHGDYTLSSTDPAVAKDHENGDRVKVHGLIECGEYDSRDDKKPGENRMRYTGVLYNIELIHK